VRRSVMIYLASVYSMLISVEFGLTVVLCLLDSSVDKRNLYLFIEFLMSVCCVLNCVPRSVKNDEYLYSIVHLLPGT